MKDELLGIIRGVMFGGLWRRDYTSWECRAQLVSLAWLYFGYEGSSSTGGDYSCCWNRGLAPLVGMSMGSRLSTQHGHPGQGGLLAGQVQPGLCPYPMFHAALNSVASHRCFEPHFWYGCSLIRGSPHLHRTRCKKWTTLYRPRQPQDEENQEPLVGVLPPFLDDVVV